jgi:nitrogenase molybdenum-iron protein NifN
MNEPKALSVNPLKASQAIGASLAILGLARSMPLEHSARGCTSFDKLFFMRHFHEPIALQTTAMEALTAVLGADDNVVEALATICRRNKPAVIGLITTGLSEMQGADIPNTLAAFRSAYPEYGAVPVVPVAAGDVRGNLESGFALAVEAIVATLLPPEQKRTPMSGQVNVLASAMLTPGDIDAIKSWIKAFGLKPVVLPDIGDSLDGHLTDEGYSPLSYGGTRLADIATMRSSIATLVVGPTLYRAADILKANIGVPDFRFADVMSLEGCDAFTEALATISGRPCPAHLKRKRDRLLDVMVDCQFQVGGIRVAIAADADLTTMLSHFFAAMGAHVVGSVISAPPRSGTRGLDTIVGDLEDFESIARDHQAEVVVTNSHGGDIARRLNAAHLRAGFPIYDYYGAHLKSWIGYDGARQTLFDLANLVAAQYREIPPYRSIYWQGTPRENEAPSC